MSVPLTEEKREELRRAAEIAHGLGHSASVSLAPAVVLALLDERLTPAEAGAIQAVSEVERLSARVAQLEAALHPFAHFAERWDANPMRGIADALYGIHGGIPEKEAELRLSDCRRARDVLGGTTEPVFTAAQVREFAKAMAGRFWKVNDSDPQAIATEELARIGLAPEPTPR